jgi:hypothetical protein
MSLGSLLTTGAPGIMARKLAEAVPVNGMTARKLVRCIAAGKQIFLAHWTIAHVPPDLTIVIVEQFLVNTHAAVLTVAKVLPAPDTTKTAIRAVIGPLFIRHP